MQFKFELGVQVKDVITGMKGVITGRCDHITGCNTYGINPQKVLSTGKPQDTEWFDENRLVIIGKGIQLAKTEPTREAIRRNGPSSHNPDGSRFNRD